MNGDLACINIISVTPEIPKMLSGEILIFASFYRDVEVASVEDAIVPLFFGVVAGVVVEVEVAIEVV